MTAGLLETWRWGAGVKSGKPYFTDSRAHIFHLPTSLGIRWRLLNSAELQLLILPKLSHSCSYRHHNSRGKCTVVAVGIDTLIWHWKVLLQKGTETELQDLNLISVKQICMVGGMNNCMVFAKPQPTAFWSLWTEEPRPHVEETLAEIQSQAGHHHKPSRVTGETANARWVEERDVKAMKGLHHCGGLWLRHVLPLSEHVHWMWCIRKGLPYS